MREAGVEPARINRWILSPVRLPIPPLSHGFLLSPEGAFAQGGKAAFIQVHKQRLLQKRDNARDPVPKKGGDPGKIHVSGVAWRA